LVQMFHLLFNINHIFLDTPICSLVLKLQVPPMYSFIRSNQGNYGPTTHSSSSPFSPHQGGYVSSFAEASPLGVQPTQ
jgi:hypothetical protein